MKFTVGRKISDNKPLKLDAAILADTRALLCASSGREIPKSELAELCGYKEGGAFNNPLGRLRTLGLIEYPAPKQARAMPFLFLR